MPQTGSTQQTSIKDVIAQILQDWQDGVITGAEVGSALQVELNRAGFVDPAYVASQIIAAVQNGSGINAASNIAVNLAKDATAQNPTGSSGAAGAAGGAGAPAGTGGAGVAGGAGATGGAAGIDPLDAIRQRFEELTEDEGGRASIFRNFLASQPIASPLRGILAQRFNPLQSSFLLGQGIGIGQATDEQLGNVEGVGNFLDTFRDVIGAPGGLNRPTASMFRQQLGQLRNVLGSDPLAGTLGQQTAFDALDPEFAGILQAALGSGVNPALRGAFGNVLARRFGSILDQDPNASLLQRFLGNSLF